MKEGSYLYVFRPFFTNDGFNRFSGTVLRSIITNEHFEFEVSHLNTNPIDTLSDEIFRVVAQYYNRKQRILMGVITDWYQEVEV